MGEDNTLAKEYLINGWDFAKAGEASCELRNLLKEIGVPQDIIRRVAIASYEAEMNIVMYAKRGIMRCMVNPQKIVIIFEDEGPGIRNIDLAMKEGFSTATPEMREMGFGAGMGLPNIKRNSDTFHISSMIDKGTHIRISFDI